MRPFALARSLPVMRRVAIGLFVLGQAVTAIEAPARGVEPVFRQFSFSRYPAAAWHPLPTGRPGGLSWRVEPANGNARVLRLEYAVGSPEGRADPGELGLQHDLEGLDGSAYDHLELWIRGDAAAGFHPTLGIRFVRPAPGHPGRFQTGAWTIDGIGPDWRRVRIPLNRLAGIDDWHALGAFALVLAGPPLRPARGAYLIRGLKLIRTSHPGPSIRDRRIAPGKATLERALGGEVRARAWLGARLAGWPSVFLADAHALPRDDLGFLRRLAADTWRGLDALTDRAHGLPLDRIEFQPGSLRLETTHLGDYTNITNIGLHLLAITAAFELRLIDRRQARERLATTLLTLESLETHHGFFYNYYNTTTLEPTSHFLSFVDSAWLTAGLIVIRQAFPEFAGRCSRLIDRGDYRFFLDAGRGLMSHGYYAHMDQPSPYHYGALYTEARLGSLIAIGKGDVPAEHWFRLERTLPPRDFWQTGQPVGQVRRSAAGFSWMAGHYRWRGESFVPSWGGSLFEALMPMLVLDEIAHAPENLGRNDRVHTRLHRLHALEDLGYPVWGMSPASTPGSRDYGEYGVRALGMAGYSAGVVSPHAAALALMTEPAEAARNLRQLLERFPIYGDFGFYDAVRPLTGEVAYHFLCLNQAMILIALANHLADHAIQRHFVGDPIVRRVLPLLTIERFPESITITPPRPATARPSSGSSRQDSLPTPFRFGH